MAVMGCPDHIPVGYSVKLVSVPSLARAIGIEDQQVLDLLEGLGVPIFCPKLGGVPYFNLPSLEIVLFKLLRPGGSGYRGHWKVTPVVDALEGIWDDMKLRKEYQFVAEHYGVMDRAAIRDHCEKIANRLRGAKARLKAQNLPRRRRRKPHEKGTQYREVDNPPGLQYNNTEGA